jgi:HSP20 family protein|tara:strand:- start:28 stop:447 length:420 start_codon:yes stop_codon:yes gene_type:complete
MMVKINTYSQVPAVFDSLLDGFLTSGIVDDFIDRSTKRKTTPRVRTSENSEAYVVSLAAPGVSKENFNVTLNGRMLTLEYNQGEEKPMFFDHSFFRKTWTAPVGTKPGDISAEYTDGVLSVIIKKTAEPPEKAEVIDII